MEEQKSKVASAQATLADYPTLVRGSTDRKDKYLKFRLLRRRTPSGKIEMHLDIREYVVDQAKADFTPKGVYFYPEELDGIIQTLVQAKKDILFHGTNSGNREQDSSHNTGEGKLV